ncbi:50S ribosomal protein L19 [Candidatus Saccharibacteria bacterium]|nr:50S ribosomal protein L19 [Candidatus Saccharibacteria bacterium]
MNSVLKDVADSYKKHAVVDVRSGDTVKVHQKIREGNKERVQVFEGMVIKTSSKGSQTASITVRRISGGHGVEKSYFLHSPLVTKVEVMKRGKVRRNYLTYMRDLRGKKARLSGKDFDKTAVNDVRDLEAEKAEHELKLAQEAEHAELEAQKAAEQAKEDAKAQAVLDAHKANETTATE